MYIYRPRDRSFYTGRFIPSSGITQAAAVGLCGGRASEDSVNLEIKQARKLRQLDAFMNEGTVPALQGQPDAHGSGEKRPEQRRHAYMCLYKNKSPSWSVSAVLPAPDTLWATKVRGDAVLWYGRCGVPLVGTP